MKSKILAAVVAAALSLGVGATAASAGGPPAGAGDGGKPAGITCMQYGLGGLRSLGAPAKVSESVVGLPLSDVLALHREDPAAANAVLKSLGFPPAAVDAACPV